MAVHWLGRWLPVLRAAAGDGPLLEIGCGSGADTAVLLAAGFDVVAFDVSSARVERARIAAPAARVSVLDLRDPWPVEGVGAVLASLSLHYFVWADTVAVFQRLESTVLRSGVLLLRVNASDDVHHGAVGYPEIEPGLFDVEGESKRFFDERTLRRLLGDTWDVLGIEHLTIDKYPRPKVIWEVAVRRR